MNLRQKRLYEYLLKQRGDFYISKEQICNDLFEEYPRHLEVNSEHNSNTFNILRHDVREINLSDADKIIVSSRFGYKIGNEEESKKYIDSRFKTALRMLKVTWNLKKKFQDNGQIKAPTDEDDEFFREVRSYVRD